MLGLSLTFYRMKLLIRAYFPINCQQAALFRQTRCLVATPNFPIPSYSYRFKFRFFYHHTRQEYLIMTVWLPTDEPSTLPSQSHHQVLFSWKLLSSVNIFDLNTGRCLGVSYSSKWCKSPRNSCNSGEDRSYCWLEGFLEGTRRLGRFWRGLYIPKAVEREVFEQTGIRSNFHSVVTIPECHNFRRNH